MFPKGTNKLLERFLHENGSGSAPGGTFPIQSDPHALGISLTHRKQIGASKKKLRRDDYLMMLPVCEVNVEKHQRK